MPSGVYPRTEKHRKIISEGQKGRKHSKEWKDNMSRTMKGRVLSEGWKRKISEAQKGKKITEGAKQKISKAQKRLWKNPKYRKRMSDAHKGYIMPEEQKKKIGDAHRGKRRPDITGPNHYNWKGGTSFEPYSPEFNRKKREKIRVRDNYTCRLCGKTEKEQLREINQKLTTHHVNYNKKNNEDSNLITLCHACNTQVNFDRLDWIIFFQNKIERTYVREKERKKEESRRSAEVDREKLEQSC